MWLLLGLEQELVDPRARLGKYLLEKRDFHCLKLIESPAQLGEMAMKRVEEISVLLVPGRTNAPVGHLEQGRTPWERVLASEPKSLHSMLEGLPALQERK